LRCAPPYEPFGGCDGRQVGTAIPADHVGSLLRPLELLRARAEHQAGRLSTDELRRVEDMSIRDLVRMQQEIGLEGVTDREFRRGSWHMDFLYQIDGVAKTDQTLRIQYGRCMARPYRGLQEKKSSGSSHSAAPICSSKGSTSLDRNVLTIEEEKAKCVSSSRPPPRDGAGSRWSSQIPVEGQPGDMRIMPHRRVW
jgi:hypothetical protein